MPLDPNDPNNNLIRGGISMPLYPTSNDVFPGASSTGVGGFFKDAAGNIVDGAGKLIMTAARAASQLPGQLSNMLSGIANNIMNDPGWSSPDYLRSMGYTEGAGTGSLWPGQASDTNFGAGGEGGSFFGGTQNFNPGLTMPSQFFNPSTGLFTVPSGYTGQVGSSSVGPPQGGGPPSTGSAMNLGNLWGGILAKHYLIQASKGLYWSPETYGQFKAQAPMYNASLQYPSYNTFHSGQVQLHDILTAHPEFLQAFLGHGTKTGASTTDRGSPAQSVERTTVGTPRPSTQ